MKNSILNLFPDAKEKECLEDTQEPLFFVTDSSTRKSVMNPPPKPKAFPYLEVRNPLSQTLQFLAIDGCLFEADGQEICDFALFNDRTFHLVELKAALGGKNTRNSERQKANSQLKTTLERFKPLLELGTHKWEATLCVGFTRPFPRIASRNQVIASAFSEKYNVTLTEGNIIEFN